MDKMWAQRRKGERGIYKPGHTAKQGSGAVVGLNKEPLHYRPVH